MFSINNNNKMLQISLTIVFLSICMHLTTASVYRDCGSTKGTLIGVKVNDCKITDKACILKKNTNASIAINFSANEPIDELTAVVYGKIAGLNIPFPLPNSNACFKSGLLCPLAEQVNYTYEATLPVYKKYPSISVAVTWELKDKNDENVVCVLIMAKIK